MVVSFAAANSGGIARLPCRVDRRWRAHFFWHPAIERLHTPS
jgi:hypothetical protein